MNFFHGLVEIPDWEKTPLNSYTYIYIIYTFIVLSKRLLGIKVTSSILFQFKFVSVVLKHA